jgi:hypothetical protein
MERKIPSTLWIGVAALGARMLIQLLVGVQGGEDFLFVAAILDAVFLAGLLLGRKWAYIGTLVFAVGGPLALLGRNPAQAITALLLNSLVVVPVILSTRFFFPASRDNLDAEKPGTERA